MILASGSILRISLVASMPSIRAKTLSLSAEAIIPNGTEQPVAFVFGPENGAVSEKLVYEAAIEARAKSYSHLYVTGFAIQPNARMLIENAADVVGIPATYVQATPDLMMGDLLKNMRSSQIFSVCGLPEAEMRKTEERPTARSNMKSSCWVSMSSIRSTMEVASSYCDDVPAWFLDTDYNGLCFHVITSFLSTHERMGEPQEGAEGRLRGYGLGPPCRAPQVRRLKSGEHGQIAVKVIDDRGNELLDREEPERGETMSELRRSIGTDSQLALR